MCRIAKRYDQTNVSFMALVLLAVCTLSLRNQFYPLSFSAARVLVSPHSEKIRDSNVCLILNQVEKFLPVQNKTRDLNLTIHSL
jgi:hypothetical protein